MKQIIILLIISFFISFSNNAYNQITRGAEEDELYISTDWYMDNTGHVHYAIFHSTNNGANIHLKYENIETPPEGEMNVGGVLGDATPGALYNYGNNELWVSFDYGETWIFRENIGTDNRYSSGTSEGEIYKYCKNPTSFIYRSINYGQAFEEINSGIFGFPEVGTNEGDFYMLSGATWPTFYIEILSSYDFGYTFSTIEIDSSIYGYYLSGMFPEISRGTESGELYLVSWWLEPNYKIFHSIDTGYTWTEKYESEYIDLYFWRVHFTAGREPGSFYVMRSRINPAGDHIWVYIDYSIDYGETFTTYFHDLDSTITGVITTEIYNIKLTNYPNPFKTNTVFKFQLPQYCTIPMLNIFDLYGTRIKEFNIAGKNSQEWDGRDENGHNLPNGVYLYNLSYGDYSSKLNRLLIIH